MCLRVADLVGIPWRVGGRTTEGVDCVGLAILAQRTLFGREYIVSATIDDYQAQSLDIIERMPVLMRPVTERMHGDVLVLRFESCIHIGTYLYGGKLLHIFEDGVSRLNSYGRIFRDRTIGVYRGGI